MGDLSVEYLPEMQQTIVAMVAREINGTVGDVFETSSGWAVDIHYKTGLPVKVSAKSLRGVRWVEVYSTHLSLGL
jgi:hypothetical protein